MSQARNTALVVDDSASMRAAMRAALAGLGVGSREAHDGADAWRLLAEQRFDLIVTDLHMPRVDGLKLVGLVRAAEAHRATGIIVVTAEGTDADLRRALDLGADAALKKPVAADLLASAVHRALRRR